MIAVTLLLGGIVIIILLLLFSKWLSGHSTKVRQAVLLCLLLVSLLANVSLLVNSIVSECFVGGEGQRGVSPNDLYEAYVFFPRPLIRSQPPHYLFYIQSRTGQRLSTVRIDSVETPPPNDIRQLPEIIHWSADSSEVEFRMPGIRFVTTVKNASATVGEE
jgi:hypothetical protein